MEMSISVEFMFAAAHSLPLYDGPCKRLHGHNYRIAVAVAGAPGRDGMIRDFDELKRVVWEKVLAKLDHTNLNDTIPNPTAENLAVWLWERLAPLVPRLQEIRIWEMPEYCVTYRG